MQHLRQYKNWLERKGLWEFFAYLFFWPISDDC